MCGEGGVQSNTHTCSQVIISRHNMDINQQPLLIDEPMNTRHQVFLQKCFLGGWVACSHGIISPHEINILLQTSETTIFCMVVSGENTMLARHHHLAMEHRHESTNIRYHDKIHNLIGRGNHSMQPRQNLGTHNRHEPIPGEH